LYNKPLMPIMY